MIQSHIDILLRHVNSIRLFTGLPADQLAALATAATERHYGEDEVVFLKGDAPTGLYVVVAGKVKMACQAQEGDEKVIDVRGAREVFGEESLLRDLPYGYLASALSKTCLLHIDKRVVYDLLQSSNSFALRMLKHMSHRVFTGMRDIEDIRLRAPLERLAGYLLDQAASARHPQPSIRLLAPKRVIASRLGMTPESFSRCLRDMVDNRILAARGAMITILDRERLSTLFG